MNRDIMIFTEFRVFKFPGPLAAGGNFLCVSRTDRSVSVLGDSDLGLTSDIMQ
jgi:hypothetical protein